LAALATKAAEEFLKLGLEIKKIKKETSLLTDATGKDLDSIVSKVRATSKVFDKEYNEVLRAANSLSKEFGISMNEAISKINEGFARGVDINGEYLETIKEYSSQIKAAGMDVDQFNELLQMSAKEGIFSDKGIDVVKEGMLRIREMTVATRDALKLVGISGDEMQKQLKSGQITIFDAVQQVAKALGNVSEAGTETGTILADVFGGPGEDAGIRFIKLLGEMDGKFSDLNDEQKRYIGLTETALLNQEKFGLAAIGATDSLATAWLNVKKQATPVLTAMLRLLTDQATKMEMDLLPHYNKWSEEALPLVKQRIDIVKESVKDLTKKVEENKKMEESSTGMSSAAYAKQEEELRDLIAEQKALNRVVDEREKVINTEIDLLLKKSEADKERIANEKKINDEIAFRLGLLQAEIGLLSSGEFDYSSMGSDEKDDKKLKDKVKRNKKIIDDVRDAETKAALEAEDLKNAKVQMSFDVAANLSNALFSTKQANLNREFLMAEGNEAKQKAISIKMAQNEKRQAIFSTIISTAKSIAASMAPPLMPLIPWIVAMGAIQLGTIMAQPIPKFARGGPIGGRKHSAGGTLIEAERGEFMINSQAYSRYPKLIEDINSLKLDSSILDKRGGSQTVVIDSEALAAELRKVPINEWKVDERGFSRRIHTQGLIRNEQMNRFKT